MALPTHKILPAILRHYPDTQAVYIFGTYGTVDERPQSDVDIALLLPPQQAKVAAAMALSDVRVELETRLQREVDLINLRQVSTVFQKEIIMAERRIFCADAYAADEFEMLVLSFYQKLNQERQGILDEFQKTRRAYPV